MRKLYILIFNNINNIYINILKLLIITNKIIIYNIINDYIY